MLAISSTTFRTAICSIVAGALLIALTPWAKGLTFGEWQSAEFSPQELADAKISGPDASPVYDGVTNLLKFALGIHAHVSAFSRLPWLETWEDGDDPLNRSFSLSYRTPADYIPEGIYYVPEASSDLFEWARGPSNIVSTISRAPDEGPTDLLVTNVLVNTKYSGYRFLRLRIYNGESLPSDWQMLYFGALGVDPFGDPDHDGKTNFQEFLDGTDPSDFFDSVTPELSIVQGGGQRALPGAVVPLSISVNYGETGAPVTIAVEGDAAILSTTPSSASVSSIAMLTARPDDSSPALAQVYIHLPNSSSKLSTLRITAGTAPRLRTIYTTASTVDPSLSPPSILTVAATSPTTAELSFTPSLIDSPVTIEFSSDGGATWNILGVLPPQASTARIIHLIPDQQTVFRAITGDATGLGVFASNALDLLEPSAGGAGGSAPTEGVAITALTNPEIYGETTELDGFRYGSPGLVDTTTIFRTGELVIEAFDPDNADPKYRGLYKAHGTTAFDGTSTGTIEGIEPELAELLDEHVEQEERTNTSYFDRRSKASHPDTYLTYRLTLSDEYTVEAFHSYVEGHIPAFLGNYKLNKGSLDDARLSIDATDTEYFIKKYHFYLKVNKDPHTYAIWDLLFNPGTDNTTHELHLWVPNGLTTSPIYTVDPTHLNQKAQGSYTVAPISVTLRLLNGLLSDLDGDIPKTISAPSLSPDNPTTAADLHSAADNDILGPLPLGHSRPITPSYCYSSLIQAQVPDPKDYPGLSYVWNRTFTDFIWKIRLASDSSHWVVKQIAGIRTPVHDAPSSTSSSIIPSAKNRLYIYDNPGMRFDKLEAFEPLEAGAFAYEETAFEITLSVTIGSSTIPLTAQVGQDITVKRSGSSGDIAADLQAVSINLGYHIPNLIIDEEKVRRIVGGNLPIEIAPDANE